MGKVLAPCILFFFFLHWGIKQNDWRLVGKRSIIGYFDDTLLFELVESKLRMVFVAKILLLAVDGGILGVFEGSTASAIDVPSQVVVL